MNDPSDGGWTLPTLERYSLDRAAVVGSRAIVSAIAIGLSVAMSL